MGGPPAAHASKGRASGEVAGHDGLLRASTAQPVRDRVGLSAPGRALYPPGGQEVIRLSSAAWGVRGFSPDLRLLIAKSSSACQRSGSVSVRGLGRQGRV